MQALQKNVSVTNTVAQTFQTGLSNQSTRIQTLQNEVSTLKTGSATKTSGSTYIRWGRNSCPSVNGTELVYSGFAAGSEHTETDAASNYICLSPDLTWEHYNDAHDNMAHVFGAEYQLNNAPS